jgi:hypothetical protein
MLIIFTKTFFIISFKPFSFQPGIDLENKWNKSNKGKPSRANSQSIK